MTNDYTAPGGWKRCTFAVYGGAPDRYITLHFDPASFPRVGIKSGAVRSVVSNNEQPRTTKRRFMLGRANARDRLQGKSKRITYLGNSVYRSPLANNRNPTFVSTWLRETRLDFKQNSHDDRSYRPSLSLGVKY